MELRKWNGSAYTSINLPLNGGNRRVLDAGSYELFAHNVGPGSSSITIEYEQVENKDVTVGGLRVSRIDFSDPVENKKITKKFEYVDDTGNSSGLLFTPASLGGHISEYVDGSIQGTISTFCGAGASAQYINLSAYTQIPLALYQGSHIGYSEVTEYQEETLISEKETGMVVHKFENTKDALLKGFPYVAQKDYSHKNGMKSEEIRFRLDGTTLKKISRTENFYAEATLPGTIRGLNFKQERTTFCYECDVQNFAYNDYYVQPTRYVLSSTIETEFDDAENPTLAMTYSYTYPSVTGHNFPLSKSYTVSNGDTRSESYSRDTASPALVKEYKLTNTSASPDIVIEGRKVAYNGKIPNEFYIWDVDAEAWVKKREMTYSANELRMVTSHPDASSSLTTSYIWGYDKTYPIVECQDILYINLAAAVISAINALPGYSNGLSDLDNLLTNVSTAVPPDRATWNAFNDNLRSQLAGKTFNTYTYKNGVGLLSATDANGISQYYQYDAFQRLIYVLDTDENVVKKYEYEYATQN